MLSLENFRLLQKEWQPVRLGDHVNKIGSGLTPRGGEAAYRKSGVPLIRSQNVQLNTFEHDGLAFISEEQDEEMSGSRVIIGDVLLNITGASIGRVCVVPQSLCPANVNQHVCIIRSDGSLDPKFLAYFLASSDFQRFIDKTQSGATRQALTKDMIENFFVPMPDLAEQMAVVKLLDKVSHLVRVQEEASRQMELLSESVFVGLFGDPRTWNDPANLKEIGEVLSVSQYGTSAKSNQDNLGVPILGMSNVTYSGQLDLNDLSYVELDRDEVEKLRLRKGDIIFNRTNSTELVGKTALWTSNMEAVLASYLVKLNVKSCIDPEYFVATLNSGYFKMLFQQRCKKAVGQSNISPTLLKEFKILVPPIAKQRRFAVVSAELRHLRAQLFEAERQTRNLFNSLSHQIFSNCIRSSL